MVFPSDVSLNPPYSIGSVYTKDELETALKNINPMSQSPLLNRVCLHEG